MKTVRFKVDAGRVFKAGEVIVCDDKTAGYFSSVAFISSYDQDTEKTVKKQKEVNDYGK